MTGPPGGWSGPLPGPPGPPPPGPPAGYAPPGPPPPGPPPGYVPSGPPPPGYYFNPPPQASRGNSGAIVAAFIGILVVVAVVVGVIVLASQPAPPVAPCQPGIPCGGPPPTGRPIAGASARPTSGIPATPRPTATAPGSPVPTPVSDSPAVISGQQVRNDALGYSFEYHPDDWSVGESSDPNVTVLNGVFFDAQIIIEAAPASVTVRELLDRQIADADRFTLGRAPDNDSYDALLGPSIGYIRGEGAVFSGTLVSRDGTPVEPVGLTLVASTNGRITVAIMVVAGQPDLRFGLDTHQYAVRSSADLILKTFNWDLGGQ